MIRPVVDGQLMRTGSALLDATHGKLTLTASWSVIPNVKSTNSVLPLM